jgi:secreted trypsin-like serine protease
MSLGFSHFNHRCYYTILVITFTFNFCTSLVDAKCGRRPVVDKLAGRIVGGKDSFYGQVPWQALVKESRVFGLIKYRKCGAVLVNERWALTAAHCAAGWLASLVIILGEHDIGRLQNGEQVEERNVKRMIIHPKFNRLLLENDIALIELDQPVKYNTNVQPICLPSAKDGDFTGKQGYVAGWGYTSYRSGTLPDVLQVVQLPIMSNSKCAGMYKTAGYSKPMPRTVVCAGLAEGGKDSCEGDSGGPLMSFSTSSQSWVLVGIVSNGIRCAEPNLPGVYTRVTQFTNWIDAVITGKDTNRF